MSNAILTIVNSLFQKDRPVAVIERQIGEKVSRLLRNVAIRGDRGDLVATETRVIFLGGKGTTVVDMSEIKGVRVEFDVLGFLLRNRVIVAFADRGDLVEFGKFVKFMADTTL